jgi:hypothetical protein
MSFTPYDESAILDACDSSIRRDHLHYFCDVAVEYYAQIVNERKEYFLEELIGQAKRYPRPSVVKVPIHTFETFVAHDKTFQATVENTLSSPGGYFKSPTRMKRANMHAIFRHSDFQKVFIKRIAPDTSRFFVTMSSEIAETNSALVTYNNTLWLNARVTTLDNC